MTATAQLNTRDDSESKLQLAREGASLASRLAQSMGLTRMEAEEPCDYEALRSEMHDDMIDRMDARHV